MIKFGLRCLKVGRQLVAASLSTLYRGIFLYSLLQSLTLVHDISKTEEIFATFSRRRIDRKLDI